MGIKIIKLQTLLDSVGEIKTKDILSQFKSLHDYSTSNRNDVEFFLHVKAIDFEKMALSTTYLVFSEYLNENILVGYFSLANKPLLMSKKNYSKLSNNQRRLLCQNGSRTESGGYRVNSYLIGQLGKNFSEEALKTKAIDGTQLLTLAYDKVFEAKQLINARFVWLECQNIPKLIKFYSDFGFKEVIGYESENNMKVMIMKLKS